MKTLLELVKTLLKINQPWKFFGILIFLSFLIYMVFGPGVKHAGMVKDAIFEEPVKVESAVEPAK